MSIDEQRLRESLRQSTADLASWQLSGDTVVRAGRRARLRRRTARGGVALAVAAVLASAAVVVTRPSGAPPAAPSPTATERFGGLSLIDYANAIHGADGEETILELGNRTFVAGARVYAGWLLWVSEPGVEHPVPVFKMAKVGMIEGSAELTPFNVPNGAVVGVETHGLGVVAADGGTLRVFRLPSQDESELPIAPMAGGDRVITALFMTTTYIYAQVQPTGGQAPYTVIAPTDFSTPYSRAGTMIGLSMDGTLAAGLTSTAGGPPCLSVMAAGSVPRAPSEAVCSSGVTFASARFSPDRKWLAVDVTTSSGSTVWLYSVDGLLTGTAQPIRPADIASGDNHVAEWQGSNRVVTQGTAGIQVCGLDGACEPADLPANTTAVLPDLR